MLILAAHPLVHWQSLWLVLAAFLAGMLNAVAGGGSFLLFPAMLGTGMLPVHANASNTVALWPGQLTSIAAYRDDMRRHSRLAVFMAVAGLIGGTSGAFLLLSTPQGIFMALVPWLLFIAAIIFAVSRPVTRWLDAWKIAAHRRQAATQQPLRQRRSLVFLFTVCVCFYIGYFGAGGGFLLITLLSLFGFEDLHEINALKVVATSFANGSAFVIFVIGRQVEWRYCLLAMAACAIGGYSSARYARKIPQTILRTAVAIIGFGMAAWFFWKTH